ncbi:ankyrin [Apiospora phragmitis]|uniref:Ankyrin n=1 Tax=Apiospora phragmitis TaxID=2905665 RepID=A0ABR1UUF7_9PEZI
MINIAGEERSRRQAASECLCRCDLVDFRPNPPPHPDPPSPHPPSLFPLGEPHPVPLITYPAPPPKEANTADQPPRDHEETQEAPPSIDAFKEEIRKLYLLEDMRLDDVMRVLDAKGVKATKKMYKTRLGKWKFFKNNRKVDVAALLKHQRQRASTGKQTAFLRHGRPIDVARYLTRSDATVDDLLERTNGVEVLEHMRCVTPPPGNSLLRSPGDLGFKEYVGHWFILEGNKHRVMNHDATSTYELFSQEPIVQSHCWLFRCGMAVIEKLRC